MKSFEQNPESKGAKEPTLEQATEKLNNLDLTNEKISELDPEEVQQLNDEIKELLRKTKPLGLPPVPSSEIQEVRNEKDVFGYLELRGEDAKNLFDQLVENGLIGQAVAEKLWAYDKKHWRETLQYLVESGTREAVLLGKNPIVEFYKEQGINIENPSAEDVEKYFAIVEYNGGSVSAELRRRWIQDKKLNIQEKANIEEIFWRLLRVPDGKGWFQNLKGEEHKKKLLALKDREK